MKLHFCPHPLCCSHKGDRWKRFGLMRGSCRWQHCWQKVSFTSFCPIKCLPHTCNPKFVHIVIMKLCRLFASQTQGFTYADWWDIVATPQCSKMWGTHNSPCKRWVSQQHPCGIRWEAHIMWNWEPFHHWLKVGEMKRKGKNSGHRKCSFPNVAVISCLFSCELSACNGIASYFWP